MSTKPRRAVVVTGFGPFGTHTINASWEAVKLLPKMINAEELEINLIVKEVPVVYEEAVARLHALWEQHKPVIMIHVGVSHKATELCLEVCAHKVGYCREDVEGKIPDRTECCLGKELRASTIIDAERIAAEVNKAGMHITCCTSNNAGLYLCEFTYYVSLSLTGSQSLFIHVPDIGKPYSPQDTAQGICEILRLVMVQIDEIERKNKKVEVVAC